MKNIENDYIHGDKFSDIAYYKVPETGFVAPPDKSGIIYSPTHYSDKLFGSIKNSNNKYVLITHNSDYVIGEKEVSKKPNCIKLWFAQNCLFPKKNIVPIPIGIERKNKGRSWNIETIKKYADIKCERKNKAFMTFNINTNKQERQKCFDILSKNENVDAYSDVSFEKHCELMSRYKFVISPPGNGLDCHRTWEALYIGCRPICLAKKGYDTFGKNIVLVNNWHEVSDAIHKDCGPIDEHWLCFDNWKRYIVDMSMAVL